MIEGVEMVQVQWICYLGHWYCTQLFWECAISSTLNLLNLLKDVCQLCFRPRRGLSNNSLTWSMKLQEYSSKTFKKTCGYDFQCVSARCFKTIVGHDPSWAQKPIFNTTLFRQPWTDRPTWASLCRNLNRTSGNSVAEDSFSSCHWVQCWWVSERWVWFNWKLENLCMKRSLLQLIKQECATSRVKAWRIMCLWLSCWWMILS